MAIYDNSRYTRTPISDRSGEERYFLKVRDRFNFNIANCSTYVWKVGDTIDKVAFNLYGFSNLRWAIMDINTKYRTEYEIEPGDSLLIPDIEEVLDIVNT